MKVDKHLSVTIHENDLDVRMGKTLTTLAYKGKDVFVFRTEEVGSLMELLKLGLFELERFQLELQKENVITNNKSL